MTLREIRARELVKPEMTASENAEYERLVRPWREQVRFNGTGVKIAAARVVGDGLVQLDWYSTEYAAIVAVENGVALPAARHHYSVTLYTHLRCRNGLVTARRSQRCGGARGMWQPAVAEGCDPADLASAADGFVDVNAMARRGLREELGLCHDQGTTIDVNQTVFHFRGHGMHHALYCVVDLPQYSIEDVVRHWQSAPDGWEHDRVEIRPPGGNTPELPCLWWPPERTHFSPDAKRGRWHDTDC